MTYSSCFYGAILLAFVGAAAAAPAIDTKKPLVVQTFTADVKGTPGFTDAARNAVIAYLKDDGLFPSLLSAEEGRDKTGALELNARLVAFTAGNMATRVVVGLGAGRASAEFDFTIKDTQSGSVVWQKRIKEKASVWSNSASSSSQRGELPDKIAKTLLKELKGGKK